MLLTMMTMIYKSVNYRIETPSGTMHVTIMENAEGNPCRVAINIGKAGTDLNAWAFALSEMISVLLESGLPYAKILEHLSSITSGERPRVAIGSNVSVRSGPEGLWVALMRYRKDKFDELRDKLSSTRIGPSVGA
jgi:ribonucleoside-diphosphate reductase alpha chain